MDVDEGCTGQGTAERMAACAPVLPWACNGRAQGNRWRAGVACGAPRLRRVQALGALGIPRHLPGEERVLAGSRGLEGFPRVLLPLALALQLLLLGAAVRLRVSPAVPVVVELQLTRGF